MGARDCGKALLLQGTAVDPRPCLQRRNAALILLLELGTSQRMGLSRSALKVQWSWWLNQQSAGA